MRRILLIVDIQKGFISNKMTEEASQRIDTLLSLELFDSIIASRYVNYPDNPIVRLMGWNDFMTNEEQHFVGATAKTYDKVVEKTRYSAVTEELLAYLEEQNHGKCPEQIYLAGVIRNAVFCLRQLICLSWAFVRLCFLIIVRLPEERHIIVRGF